MKGITPLKVPVPPMLAKAIGYTGDMRFVAFQWTPFGDEAEYSDGRITATGNWQAFLAYIQHPAVSPHLKDYDVGSSDSEATHALLLDREEPAVYIAPVKEAKDFLSHQRWPTQPPVPISLEEYRVWVDKALKQGRHPAAVDREEINRRMEEQYALVEEMQRWLNKYLKN